MWRRLSCDLVVISLRSVSDRLGYQFFFFKKIWVEKEITQYTQYTETHTKEGKGPRIKGVDILIYQTCFTRVS